MNSNEINIINYMYNEHLKFIYIYIYKDCQNITV